MADDRGHHRERIIGKPPRPGHQHRVRPLHVAIRTLCGSGERLGWEGMPACDANPREFGEAEEPAPLVWSGFVAERSRERHQIAGF